MLTVTVLNIPYSSLNTDKCDMRFESFARGQDFQNTKNHQKNHLQKTWTWSHINYFYGAFAFFKISQGLTRTLYTHSLHIAFIYLVIRNDNVILVLKTC